jgi:hypothetical protein
MKQERRGEARRGEEKAWKSTHLIDEGTGTA